MSTKRPAARAKREAEQDTPAVRRSRALDALASGAPLSPPLALAIYSAGRPCGGGGCGAKEAAANASCVCRLLPPSGAGARPPPTGLWSRAAAKAEPPAATRTARGVLRRGDAGVRFLQTEAFRSRTPLQPGRPVGLANLGATCYVAAVLQVLFQNASFRAGVYAAEPPLLARHAPLRLLRELFAAMQAGDGPVADPAPLVAALQLERGVQQDGCEFWKLLLALLERALSDSAQPSVANLVARLFRGRTSYGTTCSACGEASPAGRTLVDCYELEANVKGLGSLRPSLDEALAAEQLSGDNAYVCDSAACAGAKTSATRQLRLHSTPPWMAVSLKRFVFDRKTFSRRKVNERFAFPLSLDLRADVVPPPPTPHAAGGGSGEAGAGEGAAAQAAPLQPQPAPVYELAAILAHRGTAATSGHYTATVLVAGRRGGGGGGAAAGGAGARPHPPPPAKHSRASRSGDAPPPPQAPAPAAPPPPPPVWWRFDDETAEEMGPRPFPPPQPPATAAAAAAAGDTGGAAAAAAATAAASAGVAAPSDPNTLSSSDAYMLLYRRVGDADADGGGAGGDVPLPPELEALISLRNAASRAAAAASSAASSASVAAVVARRAAVRSTLRACTLPLDTDDGCESPSHWVSLAWLRSWANATSDSDVPPFDQSPLVCPHGLCDPSKSAVVGKRITPEGFALLIGSHGGGHPPLGPRTHDWACPACCAAAAKAGGAGAAATEARLSEAVASPSAAAALPGAVWISRPWLRALLGATKGAARVAALKAGPVDGVTCHHGGLALMPDGAHTPPSECVRVALSSDLWAAVVDANAAQPPAKRMAALSSVCPPLCSFPPCGVCEEAEARKDEALRACPTLAAPGGAYLDLPPPTTTTQPPPQHHAANGKHAQRDAPPPAAAADDDASLFAVPGSFLTSWRAWVGCGGGGGGGGGASAAPSSPPQLSQLSPPQRCDHGLLAVAPGGAGVYFEGGGWRVRCALAAAPRPLALLSPSTLASLAPHCGALPPGMPRFAVRHAEDNGRSASATAEQRDAPSSSPSNDVVILPSPPPPRQPVVRAVSPAACSRCAASACAIFDAASITVVVNRPTPGAAAPGTAQAEDDDDSDDDGGGSKRSGAKGGRKRGGRGAAGGARGSAKRTKAASPIAPIDVDADALKTDEAARAAVFAAVCFAAEAAAVDASRTLLATTTTAATATPAADCIDLATPGGAAGGGGVARRPARNRTGRASARVTVGPLSSHDTVGSLKLRVCEAAGCHPADLCLWIAGPTPGRATRLDGAAPPLSSTDNSTQKGFTLVDGTWVEDTDAAGQQPAPSPGRGDSNGDGATKHVRNGGGAPQPCERGAGDDRLLGEAGLRPGCTVWAGDSRAHDADDAAGLVEWGGGAGGDAAAAAPETGFRGTSLMGGALHGTPKGEDGVMHIE